MVKKVESIFIEGMTFKSDNTIGDYFIKNNLHENGYAKSGEVEFLLNMAIEIINRAGVNRDMDFVKNSIVTMLTSMQHSLLDNNAVVLTELDRMLQSNFDPHVDASYLGKTRLFLREQLMDFKNTTSDSIKLLLKNAEKLSTDKMLEVEGKLALIQDKLNPDLETSYLGILKKSVIAVQDAINLQFNETNKTSFVNKLQEELEKVGADDSPLVESVRTLLELERKSMNDKFSEIRDLIAKEEGKSELLEKTSQMKGQKFEDELFDVLQQYAKENGDTVTMTGTQSEVGGSKKGDYIYEFSEGIKIVIEAKDTPVGLVTMRRYLDEAMLTRDCKFSLLVAKNLDLMSKQIGNFNFYDSNKLFVTYEFVSQALKWTRLYLTKIDSNVVEGVDKTKIEALLKSIQNDLKNFANIKSKLKKLTNSAVSTEKEIVDILDNTKVNVESYIDDIILELED